MQKSKHHTFIGSVGLLLVAAWLGSVGISQAAQLLNFPFNEGSGTTTADTASGLTGKFGLQQNPLVDYVQLIAASPSAQVGDGSITNSGGGFLLVDDSSGPVLNITNGPITIETWIYIDGFSPATSSQGIAAYGSSYKMGLRGGLQVFTLFGIVDITNVLAGPIPADQWVHLAAAWEPGIGVHFYVNGTEYFEPNTTPAARPVQHNYLSIASEGFGNNIVAALDRLRIHNALLPVSDLDTNAVTPKATLASTRVAYNFNETSFPADSSVAPSRPTILSSALLPSLSSPVWTNDTPTGMGGDFALAFDLNNPLMRQRVTVDYGATPIDLGANNTNYALEAWVKLPTRLINERMVIYRSDGLAPRISLSVNNNRTLHTTLLGNTDFTTTVVIPNDNRWHHIAAVMEDYARVRFYLDGNLRQTVNRTAAGIPSDGGTPQLLIGMESDTRYLRGIVDRVRIHNNALTNSTLDFPAIPGLARITSHPSDLTANINGNATFSATVSSATAASYQWRYRTNLANLSSIPVPGATNTSLTVSNLALAHQGFYFVVVSNSVGVSESYGAKLTVRTAPGMLTPVWRLLPGDRPYITPFSTDAQTRDLERGMAYNPVTGHLLVGSRWTSPLVKGIFIVDAATGAHIGELNNASNNVVGGTIVMTRVVAADDGAIYACNFGTLSDANPLKIYRWANESASDPTIAYQGNPVSGIAANQQWGKNMIIRGAGTNTQILMDTRTTVLALFTTTDGVNFTPTLIQPDARSDDWAAGLAWGEGNTFWGKNGADPLFQWTLNPSANSASLTRSFFSYPNDPFSNFSFSTNRHYLGGLVVQTGPDAVELYDVSDLNRAPVLLDTGLFTADQTHTVGYGNVLFVGNRVFALNPNNGISAFDIRPKLNIRRDPAGVVVSWSGTGFILESAGVLPSGTWTTVPHTVQGGENVATNAVSDNAKFYRLRSQ